MIRARHFASFLAAASLLLAAPLASSAPVTLTFSGAVADWTGFNDKVFDDFPVGTLASFNITFDAEPLVPYAPPPYTVLNSVSGNVSLGSDVWTLDAGWIFSYSWDGNTNEILWYGLQFTGNGPDVSDNGSLYGLFVRLTPTLDPVSADKNPFTVGFAYPVDSGEYYSYAVLSGEFSRTTTVPEPGALPLALLAIAGLLAVGAGRRRS